MFILRTLKLMVVLIKSNFLFWGNQWTSINNHFLLKAWQHQFFTKGLSKQLFVVSKAPKVFHSHNLLKSLQYWIAIEGCAFVSNNFNHRDPTPATSNLIAVQYTKPITVSNISLHNKNYRKVLFKFLHSLLINGTFITRFYRNTTNFTVITHHYSLLRFYNYYYFKIYNF